MKNISIFLLLFVLMFTACQKDDPEADDQFEENNSILHAAALFEGTDYFNLVVKAMDEDWYKIDISADSLVIKCYFRHSNGDINMELVEGDGTVLATSNSTNDDEFISHKADQITRYFIHIYLSSGTSNTYRIWWEDM